MKCPHCQTSFHEAWASQVLPGADEAGQRIVDSLLCPQCKRHVVKLRTVNPSNHGQIRDDVIVHPRVSGRDPVSADVPREYADDYTEACMVLRDRPKASAALSRRVLQNILRTVLKVKPGNLATEIADSLPLLPAHLQHIDAIRNVGNFSAHPMKDTNTAEIIDVETHEADWMLDILDELFEYLFIRPAAVQRKKDAFNAKLKAAGKPEMT